MSRSYKKRPWCCDNSNRKEMRVVANRIVRSKLKHDPNCIPSRGKSYRKLFESWDICDYKWTSTWEQYWKRELYYYYIWGGRKPDKKEAYRDWLKFYYRK